MEDPEKEFVPTPEQVRAAIEIEERDDTLDVLASDEEKQVAAKFLPALVARITAKVEARSAQRLAEKTQELIAQNTRMMDEEVKKFRDALKPPDPKELEQLLSQEYGEIILQLPLRGGSKTYTLRELSQANEKKLMDIIVRNLVPQLKDLAAVEWASVTSNAEKLQKVLDILPAGLDMLAECCAICLDPYNEEGLTKDWVQKNLGSNRILGIVRAQLEVSKIRDFGSAVYQLFPQVTRRG
jgi:hypothetical protein